MELQKMTSFIEEQEKIIPAEENGPVRDWDRIFTQRVISYCRFLQQPITLGMFVPVDEQGNVLEEPNQEKYGWYSAKSFDEESLWVYQDGETKYNEALEQWDKCGEKVLFKGFYKEFNAVRSPDGGYLHFESLNGKIIETIIGADLELTTSALKQIGYENT
ncbi:hypothetical protein [Chryseobacterium sp. M5A1_1a]